MLNAMLNELRQEAVTTRRVLERVPNEKLSWKPHPTSMSLGQLSQHVAKIPGDLVGLGQLDEFDASQANFEPPQPNTVEEVLTALDEGIRAAETYLSTIDDHTAAANWRFTVKGNEVFSVPRIGMLRTIMNHWYHHRGQLAVYLRLLEVPVPVIYGRSADENPFAEVK
jgi:uncharacterized damage-inducible protein DinB